MMTPVLPDAVIAMEAPSVTTTTVAKSAPTPRAKVACRRCHTRRVKCDVFQTQPCRNCRIRDVACEVLSSRRGRYPRHQSRKPISPGPTDSEDVSLDQDLSMSSITVSQSHPPSRECLSVPAPIAADTVITQQQPRTRQQTHSQGPIQNSTQNHASPTRCSPTSGIDTGQDAAVVEEGSEMLFTRITEASPVQTDTESYRDSGRTFYLGESFSLAFVVKTVCNSSEDSRVQDILHYPIPQSVDDSARNVFYNWNLSNEELIGLRAKGAFDVPPQHIGERLLKIYFESFDPAYPVFDRREITALYTQGKLSYLVLHTICYLAATVCDADLLQETGFANRYQARGAYYRRAKALYDCDQERDKVKVTAVLFLLGFWWQGPEDQKDSWYWLGAAISLGQTLGMHRSTVKSGLSPRQRSLWKRIWWSIYVRDRHAAAALGRPLRIQDEDCDVEQLEPSDFEFGETEFPQIYGPQKSYHTLYAIEMSKLAILLGRVLKAEFSARRTTQHESELVAQDLRDWEQRIPPELTLGQPDTTLGAQFWARMLHACFNTTLVLLHRPRCIVIESAAAAKRDTVAKVAADATTRIAEDLLSVGTLRLGQLHLVPAIFAALSVHAIIIRRRDIIQSQLAENRSRQCMLALSELSKSWPVGGWILQLFANLLKRLTGKDFGFQVVRATSKQGLSTQNGNIPIHDDRSKIVGEKGPNGVFATEDEIHNDQHFMQNQDLNGMMWPFEEDLLPSDYLFQDAFEAFPGSGRGYMEPYLAN